MKDDDLLNILENLAKSVQNLTEVATVQEQRLRRLEGLPPMKVAKKKKWFGIA